MRHGIAMIELIFAIVIIAISVMSIPSMMNVAALASKGVVLDDDVVSRLSGWLTDKFQAKWDQNYQTDPISLDFPILRLNPDSGDLNCTSGHRINSNRTCSIANPSVIAALGDGNVSHGIEQLNGGEETMQISPSSGDPFEVTAKYAVRYVDSTTVRSGNTESTTWKLGSSASMSPDGDLNTPTNLKRVVTRFESKDINVTLTFFKSNKGSL